MMRGNAGDRIAKGLVQLRSHPSLMGLGPILDRVKSYHEVPSSVCQTMATNGKAMMFSAAFVDALSQAQLRTVLVHEALHVANVHHLRGQLAKDPETANIAMDHVINNQIIKMDAWRDGFLAPPPPDIGWMCDPKYADAKEWSFETVYRDLYVERPTDEEPDPDDDDDEEDGGEDGDENEDGNEGKEGGGEGESGEGEGEGESPSGCSGEGSGPGSGSNGGDDSESADGNGGAGQGQPGEKQERDQKSGGESGSGSKRPQSYPQKSLSMGEVWPLPPEESTEQEIQQMAEALAQGEFIAKAMGIGGGSNIFQEVREELDEDIGDWEFLRQLLESVYADERTWASPNPVYLDHGYLPSRKKSAGVLHVVFDVSGSMSGPELSACFANTAHIVEALDVSEIKVAYVDSCIRRVNGTDTWDSFDIRAGEEPTFKIVGRGGTSFGPIFEDIESEGEEVTCLIYFTDGEGYCYADVPDFPVIWATTNIPVMGFSPEPFGETVEVVAKNMVKPWWQS